MSNDCRSGTPAFIIVASWRVKRAISFSVTLPPRLRRTALTFCTMMPWRRRVAFTAASLAARTSPRMTLPALSLPSQLNVSTFGPLAAAAAVAINNRSLFDGGVSFAAMMPAPRTFVKRELPVLSL
jgi:hypothetical protein